MFGIRKKKDEKKVKFNGSENPEDYIIHNFLEIDVAKKVDYTSLTVSADTSKISLDSYRFEVDVAPLYVH